jgi:hypothetical protein
VQVRCLEGCDLFNGQECLDDATKMSKQCAAIKAAIKQFLAVEFGWDQDVCTKWPKSLRTLQILMKTSEVKHFLEKPTDGGKFVEYTTKIGKWKERTGCGIWIAFDSWAENDEEAWLVSIVGVLTVSSLLTRTYF